MGKSTNQAADTLRKTFPTLSAQQLLEIQSPKQRAKWAMYSGPFKLTPAYNADPVGAFPFQGRGLMTQKMDGMFMLWDGVGQMYNRGRGGSGSSAQINEQHPPQSFYKHLPPVELEGELCYRSGEYSRGHAATKDGWTHACLFVFDAPLHPGTYAERWQYINELLAGYDPRYVRPVPFLGIATTRRVMDATLSRVRATKVPTTFGSSGLVGASYEGGEGVMIRDPDALYTYSCFEPRCHGHKKGQTTALYKWLEEYGNDECRVLAVPEPGAPTKGKRPRTDGTEVVSAVEEEEETNATPNRKRQRKKSQTPQASPEAQSAPNGKAGRGEMGSNSLWVALPNGTQFVLNSISRLGVRASDIAVGSIVTFTYHGWARGLPLNASAHSLRTDRTWEDITNNFIPPPAQLGDGLGIAEQVKRMASLD